MGLGFRLATCIGLTMASATIGHLAANASMGEAEPRSALRRAIEAALGDSDYPLGQLRLFERTRYFVEDKYVEPERIDPEAMFVASLDGLEREIPEVIFRRVEGSRLLHLAIGDYRTTLEVPVVDTLDELMEQMRRVAVLLEDHLDPELDRANVEYGLINGMLSTLDPHTVLMPPDLSREMEVENQGEFGGLGITITITRHDGLLTVEYPLQDTPAYRAGLKAGDKIIRIEDESTLNMDLNEAVSKLRGPVGQPVSITVDRESFERPRVFTIVRATIRINPVEGELMEGGIGFVRIKSFHASTARDMEALLSSFRRENGGPLKGLILDLRSNPGGYLHQATEVTDHFLAEGVIVATVEEGRREEKRAHYGNTEPDYPMVVLVNANSASASEIVSGALKNHQRALIVGDHTFGKGSVQNLYPNADDSRLKLTVAKYLTPGDQSIQSVGIPPDIRLIPSIVELTEDEETGETSPSVSLYWTERISREVDLDRALGQVAFEGEEPAFTLRYLATTQRRERVDDSLDLSGDWEVGFAQELLLSTPSARRAEFLASAADVVERRRVLEEARVIEAFTEVDVVWESGETPDSTSLSIELDVGEDGVVDAALAEEETLALRVTNQGSETLYQVLATTESDIGWLDGQEFFLGRLAPGETRSWPQPLGRVTGHSDEMAEVLVHLQDGQENSLGETRQLIRLVGQTLPDFAWTMQVFDDGTAGSEGDGDGLVEEGEIIVLRTDVTNSGSGVTGEGFVRLHNLSGNALDLEVGRGTLESLAPGDSAVVDLRFEVRDASEALEVEISVGDLEFYDYTAVVRGGFYGYHTQTYSYALPRAEAGGVIAVAPPRIQVSRSPDLLVEGGRAVLSGLVRDEGWIRDLLVFHGEEKIHYEGGSEGMSVLPFSVEVELEEGANSLIVLARDHDGLTDIRSLNVYYDPTGVAALGGEAPLSRPRVSLGAE